jgi:hypothetical protein
MIFRQNSHSLLLPVPRDQPSWTFRYKQQSNKLEKWIKDLQQAGELPRPTARNPQPGKPNRSRRYRSNEPQRIV